MDIFNSQSLPPALIALAILILTAIFAFLFDRTLKKFIKSDQPSPEASSPNLKFVRRVGVALIYAVGFTFAIYSIPDLKSIAQSLLAGAGIAAIAVGFASQAALTNIISGVFIVLFKPYRIGDRVQVKDTLRGIVEDITLRHTVIRDFQHSRIVIPNSIISNEVIVNSDLVNQKICRWIEVGIGYQSDIDIAKQILAQIVGDHPNYLDERTAEDIENAKPKVQVRVTELGEYFVRLRAWAWVEDTAAGFVLQCEVLEEVKKRFDLEGIEIPFPYRSVVMQSKGEG